MSEQEPSFEIGEGNPLDELYAVREAVVAGAWDKAIEHLTNHNLNEFEFEASIEERRLVIEDIKETLETLEDVPADYRAEVEELLREAWETLA